MKLPSVPRLGPTVWGIAAFLLVLATGTALLVRPSTHEPVP